MIKRENKRGLSEVVTNLLLILLVLVAVGVVWVVVKNLVSEGAGGIEIGQFTFDLQIQNAYISGTDVIVSVRRNAGGGELAGIKFLFSNETESITIDKIGALNELDRRTFTFTSAEIPGIGMGDEVSIAPIYESGGQKTGGITDSATISGNPPAGSGGTGNPGTGTCGDSLIQNPNSDGINEQCDGNNLGGQTCTDLGFVGGTLSCTPGCQFDTSQCAGAAPLSCNGVWEGASEDPGVVCDGGANCLTSCVCRVGFTADGSGGCVIGPPLGTGIINSVWNKIYFDSHDLPKDDSVWIYQSKYVNFTNSAEFSCFQITLADYAPDSNISYIRLSDTPPLGAPNINAGETYNIWGAVNCGQ